MTLKCFPLMLGARNPPAAGKPFSCTDDELIRAITYRHFPTGLRFVRPSGNHCTAP